MFFEGVPSKNIQFIANISAIARWISFNKIKLIEIEIMILFFFKDCTVNSLSGVYNNSKPKAKCTVVRERNECLTSSVVTNLEEVSVSDSQNCMF